jgi:hypothetical protein
MPAAVVYDAPGEVTVLFDEDAAEILVTWTRFGDEAVFRASLDVQADLVGSGRARIVIVDTADSTGVPSAKDLDHLTRFVFPRYREGGLEAILTVVPRSARTKMGAMRWVRSGSMWRFPMYEVASVEDARAVIAEKHARSSVS